MRDYLFNFWVWWYLVRVPAWGSYVLGRIVFFLEYTNTLTMAKFLTVPLFQDDSGFGKFFSFLVRVIWVWFGGLFTSIFAIPLLLSWFGMIILPVLTVVLVVLGFINML